MSKIYKNNTSGVPGVCYKTRDAKWFASINVKGEKISLGYFRTKEQAIEARLDAEKLYKKQFNDLDGFKLVHFVIQIKLGIDIKEESAKYNILYLKGCYALFDAAKIYAELNDTNSRFEVFAVRRITDFLTSSREPFPYYVDASIYNKENCWFIDWINGESLNKLSKDYQIPLTSLSRMIKNFVDKKIFLKK